MKGAAIIPAEIPDADFINLLLFVFFMMGKNKKKGYDIYPSFVSIVY